MNNELLSRESQSLILKCFDQPLVELELVELTTLLRSEPAARKFYLDAVQMHTDLTAQNEAVQLAKSIFAEFPSPDRSDDPPVGAAPELCSAIPIGKKPSRIGRYFHAVKLPYAALVLASGMCVGCGIGIVAASAIYDRVSFAPFEWTRVVEDDVAARVTATHNCEWQPSESPETLPTRSLHAGQQIRIQEGLLQLIYSNGLSVLLEGPAVYEVRSKNGGKLYTGKMSVTAPLLENAFVIETQRGAMQINNGQVGIVSDDDGTTTYAALIGHAQVDLLPRVFGKSGASEQLFAGQATQVREDGAIERLLTSDLESFVYEMPMTMSSPFTGDSIMLGNLFDDSTTASLTEAMQSDVYQAAGETIDLGVAAVRDGGLDVDFPLVDGGVQFNLASVGGNGQRVRGLPSNDTFRSVSIEPIRTRGRLQRREEVAAAKIEDGVGMSANELITFDLDELRTAGHIDGFPLRFVSERAGINDLVQDNPDVGAVRMVAIVSSQNKVLAGYVNGEQVRVEQHAGVYRFHVNDPDEIDWLRRDGRFVEFDFDLPPQAKFLTLAALSGEIPHDDHSVFSGARLEIVRHAKMESKELANVVASKQH